MPSCHIIRFVIIRGIREIFRHGRVSQSEKSSLDRLTYTLGMLGHFVTECSSAITGFVAPSWSINLAESFDFIGHFHAYYRVD